MDKLYVVNQVNGRESKPIAVFSHPGDAYDFYRASIFIGSSNPLTVDRIDSEGDEYEKLKEQCDSKLDWLREPFSIPGPWNKLPGSKIRIRCSGTISTLDETSITLEIAFIAYKNYDEFKEVNELGMLFGRKNSSTLRFDGTIGIEYEKLAKYTFCDITGKIKNELTLVILDEFKEFIECSNRTFYSLDKDIFNGINNRFICNKYENMKKYAWKEIYTYVRNNLSQAEYEVELENESQKLKIHNLKVLLAWLREHRYSSIDEFVEHFAVKGFAGRS